MASVSIPNRDYRLFRGEGFFTPGGEFPVSIPNRDYRLFREATFGAIPLLTLGFNP